MQTPRILAINNVHLAAPPEAVQQTVAFYADLIGLQRIDAGAEGEPAVLRGHPRSGPRLIVSPGDRPRPPSLRRDVLIEVTSLSDYAEQIGRSRIPHVRSQGWTYFDERLTALDPAGHRVELVAYHPL